MGTEDREGRGEEIINRRSAEQYECKDSAQQQKLLSQREWKEHLVTIKQKIQRN